MGSSSAQDSAHPRREEIRAFRRAEFGDRLFADRVLEPVDEARDGHAVLDVGKALVLLLRGRSSPLSSAEWGSCGRELQRSPARFAECGSWRARRRAVRGCPWAAPRRGGRCRHRGPSVTPSDFKCASISALTACSLHAERGRVLLKQQIREKHGREEHIVSAQVQSHATSSRDGMTNTLAPISLHLAAHHCELFPARQTCVLNIQLPHRLARECGAVRPHKVDKILVARKADVLLARLFADRTSEVVADRARVEADPAVSGTWSRRNAGISGTPGWPMRMSSIPLPSNCCEACKK